MRIKAAAQDQRDVKFNKQLRELWLVSDLIGHAVHNYALGSRAQRIPNPKTIKRLRELAEKFHKLTRNL